MEKIKVLVTGAGGFIGCNMVAYLKERGYYVRAVDKKFVKSRHSLFGQADEIMYLNLLEFKSCMIATEGIDWVVHLASDMGGVGYFHKQDYFPFLQNMTIDINMLEAARANKVQRLFYSSSACIYPRMLQMEEGRAPKLKETDIFPADADQMYGWEKLMMTMLCQRSPLDTRVGIFHTIYGPYQEIEGERMKFPTAIATKALRAKKDGKPIDIWGNGKQIRSFLYISDALEKIHLVLTQPYKHPVNIASDEAVSVEEIALMCCEIVGINPELTFNDKEPSGVLARNADNTVFDQLYGYKNKVTLKEGFTNLINWIQTNEESSNSGSTG